MGVPLGTRWLILCFSFDFIPIVCIASQSGIERLNVILKWDVGAKVYGIKLHKLKLRISRKVAKIHLAQINCVDFPGLINL